MAIKVFCKHPEFVGYQTNPPDIFLVTASFVIFEDTGGENNGPRSYEEMVTLYLPLGSSPTDAFQEVYTAILAACAANSFATPTKADIFSWSPMPFTVLVPD